MSDPRDYKVELLGAAKSARAGNGEGSAGTTRPFVSVHFACCNVYLRIYRSADGKHYRGRCPRCGVPVNFVVGEGGTEARTFVVR
jgi:hypothetical protein